MEFVFFYDDEYSEKSRAASSRPEQLVLLGRATALQNLIKYLAKMSVEWSLEIEKKYLLNGSEK